MLHFLCFPGSRCKCVETICVWLRKWLIKFSWVSREICFFKSFYTFCSWFRMQMWRLELWGYLHDRSHALKLVKNIFSGVPGDNVKAHILANDCWFTKFFYVKEKKKSPLWQDYYSHECKICYECGMYKWIVAVNTAWWWQPLFLGFFFHYVFFWWLHFTNTHHFNCSFCDTQCFG